MQLDSSPLGKINDKIEDKYTIGKRIMTSGCHFNLSLMHPYMIELLHIEFVSDLPPDTPDPHPGPFYFKKTAPVGCDR